LNPNIIVFELFLMSLIKASVFLLFLSYVFF